MTNAVFLRKRKSRMASRVEIVVSGRQRSRSSMRTTRVTPNSSSVSSNVVRSACISFGGEVSAFAATIPSVAVATFFAPSSVSPSSFSLTPSVSARFPSSHTSPASPIGGNPNASAAADPPTSFATRSHFTRLRSSLAFSTPVFRFSASSSSFVAMTSMSAARASS